MTALVATPAQMLIADVDEFRTWVGAADQAEALLRVYVAGVDEGSYTRPFALILTGAAPAARRYAGGSRDYHDQSGRVGVLFEDDASGDTLEDELIAFLNDVGPIVSGILELAGQDGYPHLRSLTMAEAPRRSGEDEQDDYLQVFFDADWGL